MEENSIDKQSEQLISQLSEIREAFFQDKRQLKMSIRKDIIAVTLKDILYNNPSYDELKQAIETLIQDLYRDI